MLERGIVREVGRGVLTLEMVESAACASCGVCSDGEGGARVLEDVLDPIGASLGDIVEFEIPDGSRRRAQVLVFLVPVIALVLGYLAGFLLLGGVGVRSDTAGAVVGLIAGVAALLSLRYIGRSTLHTNGYEPRVHAIISRGSQRRTTE